MATALRAAIYARVSTLDQEPENQMAELREPPIDAPIWMQRVARFTPCSFQ